MPAPRPTIHVIGNVNVDLILGPVDEWPRRGTEIVLPHSDLRVGGAAGNVSLALSALGSPYRLYGNCGNDVFGQWLAERLGIEAFGGGRMNGPTTISVGVVHPDDERTFLTTEGHLAEIGIDDFSAEIETIRPGDIALLLGTFLSPRLMERYEDLIARLAARGARIALDTGWPPQGWTPGLRERVISWLPSCSILLFNEIETASLAGAPDSEAAAETLRRHMGDDAIVVTKRGALGAVARQAGRVHVADAPHVRVVDTIGAGDIFNAAFLTSLLEGRDLVTALDEAVRVASHAISTHPRRIHRPSEGDDISTRSGQDRASGSGKRPVVV